MGLVEVYMRRGRETQKFWTLLDQLGLPSEVKYGFAEVLRVISSLLATLEACEIQQPGNWPLVQIGKMTFIDYPIIFLMKTITCIKLDSC